MTNRKQRKQTLAKVSVAQVIQQHAKTLLSSRAVIGIAEGEYQGEPCIKLLLSGSTGELPANLPDQLAGYPVVTEVSGEIKARAKAAKIWTPR